MFLALKFGAEFSWITFLAFLLGALVTWLLARFGLKRGKKYEDVFDRVVEESTDESTKLRTLTDEHALALRNRDDAVLKLRGEHDAALLKLKGEHDAALTAQRGEVSKLQGFVSAGDTAKADLDKARLELTKAKEDHARLELDWKKRIETAEAAATTRNAKITELETAHAKTIADWDTKLKASEAKHVQVQGLVGTAKADNDKVVADWSARYSKLEAELASARTSNHDWESKYKALEADLVGVRKQGADWETRYKTLEADSGKSSSQVQTLTGDLAAARKGASDWEVKYKALEGDLAGARKGASDWEVKYKGLEGDLAGARKGASDWEAKYTALNGEVGGLRTSLTDWEGRYRKLEADHAGCGSQIQGLTSQLGEATAGPDDLLIIEGIGPKINQALNAAGITRWKHVRDAEEATLRSAIEKAGISLAPSITTWSRQARFLCDNDNVGFHAYTEYLTAGRNDGGDVDSYIEQARPRIAQMLASGKDDLHTADGKDNLLIIEGIGPKFNEALLRANIDSFAKVAASSEDQLKGALSAAGLSFAPSLSTWAKQAELLRNGDRKAFDEYVAFLIAGRA